MRGVNKVIIVGTLGRDVEVVNFGNGGKISKFSLATSEAWTDKNSGEKKEATEWHQAVCNNRLAEIAEQFLVKGSKVYIEGSLKTRNWTDNNGQERFSTEIRVEQLQMLDGPKKNNGTNLGNYHPEGGGNQGQGYNNQGQGYNNQGQGQGYNNQGQGYNNQGQGFNNNQRQGFNNNQGQGFNNNQGQGFNNQTNKQNSPKDQKHNQAKTPQSNNGADDSSSDDLPF